jgi:SAM-dependent methyltransferase
LEIGCGDGRLSVWLKAQVGSLVGIDPARAALYQAQGADFGLDLLAASGQALPFAPDVFDLVLFSLSLHHHQDCEQALGEARRVLGPEGCLLVLEPRLDSELSRVCSLFQVEDQDLRRARKALDRLPGPLKRVRIEARWRFADARALIDWVTSYYHRTVTVDQTRQMLGHLGGRAKDRPLVVEDDLDCYLVWT